MSRLHLEVVVSPLFAQNAYLAWLDGRSDCLIIDPGFDAEELIAQVTRRRLTVSAILNTHGHADHIAGNSACKRCWPLAPLVIGAGDEPKLTDPVLNLSRPFGFDVLSPPADTLVREGDIYSAAGLDLEVLACPGHSVGHVVFVYRGQSPGVIFGGDVLFRESIGRTDFPDGSFADLAHSIRTKLYLFPDDTIVLPGHGEATTIGFEKRHNPFVPASDSSAGE